MEDVHLNLWHTHLFMSDAITSLKPLTEDVFGHERAADDWTIRDMLWDDEYPEDISNAERFQQLKVAVKTRRLQMKVFLEVNLTGNNSASSPEEFLLLYKNQFTPKRINPTVPTQLLNGVREFLDNEGKDVALPVILFHGRASRSENGDIILRFPSGQQASSKDIFEEFKSTPELRVIFMCDDEADGSSKLASTNANLPGVRDSEIGELKDGGARAAVGDGPLNKKIKAGRVE